MKRSGVLSKISVGFVERAVDLPNFSGFMEVIETTCECVDGQNGEKTACRYLIHWRTDEEGRVKRYAHQVEKDGGLPSSLESIPYEIYQRMHGEALSFFNKERTKDAIQSLHDYVITVDPHDKSKASIRFKGRKWSPYQFTFRLKPNGKIDTVQTITNIVLADEHARDGHRRPPPDVRHAAYDFISKHFAGCLNSDDHTQCELELGVPSTSE